MPIYEYRCSSCGHKLEALQKFSDPPLVACPACSKEALVKLVSAAGFQLKGSGWYATDFKGSSGGKPAGKADGSEAKPAEGKDADAKTAPKSETATSTATSTTTDSASS
jgi:putative FmdB family regulatory protein